MSANGYGHREIAARLGVGPRAVNNALQRARRKVFGRRVRSPRHDVLPLSAAGSKRVWMTGVPVSDGARPDVNH